MKVHLGCGGKLLEGWTNVDLAGNWSGIEPDIAADITERLPFPDECADEVMAIHVIEHLWRWDAERVLAEWVRVLKPGGKLILECPCLEKILALYVVYGKKGKNPPAALTIHGLYGDPYYKSEEMTHKWCYSSGELSSMLTALGLSTAVKEPETHSSLRDMRIEATK